MRYYDEIVRLRAPLVTSDYTGDEERDWSDDTTIAKRKIRADVQPQSTTEVTTQRELVVDRWRVLCPPDDVISTDRILWNGDVYEVDGDVGLFLRRGVRHHMEFALKRFQGG